MSRLRSVYYAIILVGACGACSAAPVKPSPIRTPALVNREVAAPALTSVSGLEAMQAALPAYALLDAGAEGSLQSVSVVRDLAFEHGSTILDRREAERLRPLVAYLVDHPELTVLIEAYGNGATLERDGEMGLARAYAVARVLRTDFRVANRIVTAPRQKPRERAAYNTAVVTVIFP